MGSREPRRSALPLVTRALGLSKLFSRFHPGLLNFDAWSLHRLVSIPSTRQRSRGPAAPFVLVFGDLRYRSLPWSAFSGDCMPVRRSDHVSDASVVWGLERICFCSYCGLPLVVRGLMSHLSDLASEMLMGRPCVNHCCGADETFRVPFTWGT